VISAVSGGAAGTMFFVNQYASGGPAPGFQAANPTDLHRIIEQAEAPALSDIAWAIVYVDPLRVFFPYLRVSEEQKTLDRGFVLEQTWRNRGPISATLSEWRDGVTRGSRPGIIFNSTLAETGQPFLLTTTEFDTGPKNPARQTFAGAYPRKDIPVVTAARLAASFPYVSPATRALTSRPDYHVVDGGYYDNFGVDSLSSWLDQALKGLDKDHRPDVLVIQIRSFPTGSIPDPSTKGWFYQSYAPVDALLSVRTTAQLVRDRDELELLQKKWAAVDDVRMKFATFEFAGKEAPLSWQLTAQQTKMIEFQWQNIVNQVDQNNDLQSVRSFCNPRQGEMPATATAPR
jgi:predicted acylesterase/phospholipase RssA